MPRLREATYRSGVGLGPEFLHAHVDHHLKSFGPAHGPGLLRWRVGGWRCRGGRGPIRRQSPLRHQPQPIGHALLEFRLRVLLVQSLVGPFQGLLHKGPDFRVQAAPDQVAAVLILMEAKEPALVPLVLFLGIVESFDPPPGPDQLLELGGSGVSGYIKEILFVFRRGDPGQGPNLRLGEGAVGHGLGD